MNHDDDECDDEMEMNGCEYVSSMVMPQHGTAQGLIRGLEYGGRVVRILLRASTHHHAKARHKDVV